MTLRVITQHDIMLNNTRKRKPTVTSEDMIRIFGHYKEGTLNQTECYTLLDITRTTFLKYYNKWLKHITHAVSVQHNMMFTVAIKETCIQCIQNYKTILKHVTKEKKIAELNSRIKYLENIIKETD